MHIFGYFPSEENAEQFADWLLTQHLHGKEVVMIPRYAGPAVLIVEHENYNYDLDDSSLDAKAKHFGGRSV